MRKTISIIVIVAFFVTSIPAFAQRQAIPWLPVPGTMVDISPAFTPAQLKGIVIHSENALKFDFIIDQGNSRLSAQEKQVEYKKLIKYFLASLAVPDRDQWVNLSPYEKNRIIEKDFGQTLMGRDLLAQDYLLKQITSSLIYPEKDLGRKFWQKVYTQAQAKYGNTNIPVNTFNKVWIVSDKAVIYEKGNVAYVLENHLKVMLEEDYLALSKHQRQPGDMSPKGTCPQAGCQANEGLNLKATQGNHLNASPDTHSVASQIIRELVLPQLEKEVNQGQNFALLRQIYSGMLLAAWYKRALKESLLGKIYNDKDKLQGVNVIASEAKQSHTDIESIYQRYLQAFKKGVFNYIKEEPAGETTVPRKYFSGGMIGEGQVFDEIVTIARRVDSSQLSAISQADAVTADLQPVSRNYNAAMSSHKTLIDKIGALEGQMSDRPVARGQIPAAAGFQIRPGRLVLDDRIVDMINFWEFKATEITAVMETLNLHAPDAMQQAISKLYETVLPGYNPKSSPVYIGREKFSILDLFLVALVVMDIIGWDGSLQMTEYIMRPGHIIIPESMVQKFSWKKLEQILAHEEHHKLWDRLRKERSPVIAELEETYAQMLDFGKKVTLTINQRKSLSQAIGVNENQMNNLTDAFMGVTGFAYKDLAAGEFWIQLGDTINSPLKGSIAPQVRVMFNYFRDRALSEDPPLAERLQSAMDYLTDQRQIADQEAREDINILKASQRWADKEEDVEAVVMPEMRATKTTRVFELFKDEYRPTLVKRLQNLGLWGVPIEQLVTKTPAELQPEFSSWRLRRWAQKLDFSASIKELQFVLAKHDLRLGMTQEEVARWELSRQRPGDAATVEDILADKAMIIPQMDRRTFLALPLLLVDFGNESESKIDPDTDSEKAKLAKDFIERALKDRFISSDPQFRELILAFQRASSNGFYNLKGRQGKARFAPKNGKSKITVGLDMDLIRKLLQRADDHPADGEIYKQIAFSLLIKEGAQVVDMEGHPDRYLKILALAAKANKGELDNDELKHYAAKVVEIEAIGFRQTLLYLIRSGKGQIFSKLDALAKSNTEDGAIKGAAYTYALLLYASVLDNRESDPKIKGLNLRMAIHLITFVKEQELQGKNRAEVLEQLKFLNDPSYYSLDNAQLSPTDDNLGGIDMNAANMDLQIKRDGRGAPLPLAQQDMAQLAHIQGLEPEILEIKPAVNVPAIRQLQYIDNQ